MTVIEPAEIARAHRQRIGGRRQLLRLVFALVLFALMFGILYALDLLGDEDSAIMLPAILLGMLIWVFRKRPGEQPEPGPEPKP